ncbi:DUF4870 domain-containing protein [Candidatus Saccharibacteria bacterium]|nr:DUF4870 domain-containing protein [Candidatus Saccharibacteria bacterium]
MPEDNKSVSVKSGSDNDKLMGILAYMGLLVIVPIVAGGDSKFVKYHANQGLVNVLLWVAIFIINIILAFIPFVGFITLFTWVLYFVPIIFAILGIVNVVNNEQKPLPIIGEIQIIK